MQDLAGPPRNHLLPLLQPLWRLTLQVYLVRPFITVHPAKASPSSYAAVGTIAAILYPMDDITDFLYLIGSCICNDDCHLISGLLYQSPTSTNISAYLERGLIWALSVGLYTICYSESTIGATLPVLLWPLSLQLSLDL